LKRWKVILGVVYLLAVMASWAVQHRSDADFAPQTPSGMSSVEIGGEVRSKPYILTIAYREWMPQNARETEANEAPVVVLLHGAPGDSSNFGKLGPMLAARGCRVIAFDQPGFGASSAWGFRGRPIDLSIKENARRIWLALNAIGVQRAHVVGWSNGGGTAMWMAERGPHRLASLTLIGSIGVQELEGSGSNWVEQFKYAFGKILVGVLPELVPHFGLLGSVNHRIGWLRNFSDSDQRELRGVMERIEASGTDTLILHGAYDVLAPLRVAEETRRAMPSARMLVLDANHFLPFRQAEETADAITGMVRGGEGLPQRGVRADRWTAVERTGVLGVVDAARLSVREAPWWVHVIALAACAAWSPVIAIALAGVAIVGMQGPAIDPFVAVVGLVLGVVTRNVWKAMRGGASRVDWTRRIDTNQVVEGWQGGVMHGWRGEAAAGFGSAQLHAGNWFGMLGIAAFVVGIVVWGTIAMFASIVGMAIVEHEITPQAHGIGVLVGWLVYLVAIWKIGWPAARWAQLLSVRGWRWLLIGWERLTLREYWPTWAWYVLVLPGLLGVVVRNRGVLWWLAANPGVPAGGGWVGESKWEILAALGDDARIARAGLVQRGGSAAERASACERVMRERGLGFPVILKPDVGERGFAVKLARGVEDVLAYFETVHGDVIVQAYASGPKECGILWTRRIGADWEHERREGLVGSIYSITAKEFPEIVGDGERTLEALIERHPRFRRQHRTFLERWRDDASRVLGKGEVVRLSMAGNHCQGTMFFDGGHLITTELTRAIDEIARRYGQAIGKPDSLDYARFDVRYESDEKLHLGEGLVIVEMNGTSAESTNIYDPKRSIGWAWRVLVGQWEMLTELGRWRVSLGAKRWTLIDLWKLHREAARARRGRGGSSVSD
jgi:pimeloyl-ACP methyl ester carboxylesterase